MRSHIILLFCIVVSLAIIVLVLMTMALFQQTSRPFLMGTGIMLIAVSMFCIGLLQLWASKTIGTPIPWWKQPFIMIALFFFCFGSFYFLPLVFNVLSLTENFQTIVSILYVVLVLALGIYGIVLAFQFAVDRMKKGANTSPKTQSPDQ